MRNLNRKATPRVVKGNVQKKNNWTLSEDYYYAPRRREVVIDRKRPQPGYRHLLTKKDILDFIALLPDWDEIAVGLNAIVLAPGSRYDFGYHVPGVVHIHAWEEELWIYPSDTFYKDHFDIFQRLRVPCELDELGQVICKFTEDSARAFQLLHIFLHELGHHHDRMTTRRRRRAGRGEQYAEEYALKYEAQIWQQYVRTFKLF